MRGQFPDPACRSARLNLPKHGIFNPIAVDPAVDPISRVPIVAIAGTMLDALLPRMSAEFDPWSDSNQAPFCAAIRVASPDQDGLVQDGLTMRVTTGLYRAQLQSLKPVE